MKQSVSNYSNVFGRFLVEEGLLTADGLDQILKKMAEQNISIIRFLNENNSICGAKLASAISNYFKLPFFSLDPNFQSSFLQNHLDLKIIKKNYSLPLYLEEGQLIIGTSDPTQIDLQELNFCSGYICKLVIVEHKKLIAAIQSLDNEYLEAKLELSTVEPTESTAVSIDALRSEHSPVVMYLNHIFEEAILKKASDIHFEPFSDFFRIRFRIDGVLYEEARPAQHISQYIAARLKVLAGLDIAERRQPQDGRFSISIFGEARDVRLSTCPTQYGEKCVLRLLATFNKVLAITELGLNRQHLQQLRNAISQPQGMILVTGPTGSGKTTTLYSVLVELNDGTRNILSIEDPIEIAIPGINQTQIHSLITFEAVLRACLRQDPDVILLGEIRDLTTAEIAINAADTGHLVFSTLHSNSAMETLSRLTNLGIPSHKINNSLKLIIAQRLLRRLCDYCKVPSRSYSEHKHSKPINCFSPKGCLKCNNGFKGRIGIFELAIPGSANSWGLVNNLKRSALELVQNGFTSYCEVQRVLGISHDHK